MVATKTLATVNRAASQATPGGDLSDDVAGYSVVTDEDTENVVGMLTEADEISLADSDNPTAPTGYYYYDPSGNKVVIP